MPFVLTTKRNQLPLSPYMVSSDPDGSGGPPDIYKLFCDYNGIYFGDSLVACAVSWAEDPLPGR